VEPHHLVERIREVRESTFDEGAALPRVVEQQLEAVGEQIGGGVVADHHEHDALRGDLVVVVIEPLGIWSSEDGKQPGTAPGARGRDVRTQVVDDVEHAFLRSLQLLDLTHFQQPGNGVGRAQQAVDLGRDGGAPSRSHTTDIASGWASSFTTSTGPPWPSAASRRPSISRWIVPTRPAMRRGVKYFLTTRRKTS
jgi:hypothetical protein